jgi:NADH-quinone oxidoreductase subunit J
LGSETALFYLFGTAAVVASLLVIGQRNPIYSVLLLIASFGALSGLYVLLDAPFVAVVQIIVYAGAIMVLFLFVVMLLNAPHEDTEYDEQSAGCGIGVPGAIVTRPGPRRFGAALAVALVVELVWTLRRSASAGETAIGGDAVSSVRALGRSLFTDYGLAFEVTSVLILVAMVGAVTLARRERVAPRIGGPSGPAAGRSGGVSILPGVGGGGASTPPGAE